MAAPKEIIDRIGFSNYADRVVLDASVDFSPFYLISVGYEILKRLKKPKQEILLQIGELCDVEPEKFTYTFIEFFGNYVIIKADTPAAE
jgi:hypothetical protein